MRILLCALFGHNRVRFFHIYVVILCIYIHISQKNMHISGAHFFTSVSTREYLNIHTLNLHTFLIYFMYFFLSLLHGKIKFQYFSKIKNKNFFRNSFFQLVFDGFFFKKLGTLWNVTRSIKICWPF